MNFNQDANDNQSELDPTCAHLHHTASVESFALASEQTAQGLSSSDHTLPSDIGPRLARAASILAAGAARAALTSATFTPAGDIKPQRENRL
jgi:hypothetical protein